MDTFICGAPGFAVCLLMAFAPSAWAQEINFCALAPHDKPCSVFPEDQRDFSRFFEYRVVDAAAQRPFDEHAWQSFVALNWSDVEPKENKIGWRGFARTHDVFETTRQSCVPETTHENVVIADLTQSDGNALIDQSGNFIVYEKRLNGVAEDYILDNGLDRLSGRSAYSGTIAFPMGVDQDQPASVLIKTAWRVLGHETSDYIQANGIVPVPAGKTTTGHSLCIEVRLGMIGMHIVSKVQSGHGDKWIWSTFEHVNNVPIASNARSINSLYAPELFPNGCLAPVTKNTTPYVLFDPLCPECATNVPPMGKTKWAGEPPFARSPDGEELSPSQIVRCWKIFGPTEDMNAKWQAALHDTPLRNYMLVSSQWRGANPDPIFTNGELPRYLSNAAMETYIQTDPIGSCLGCHAAATTSDGTPSDFTFLLRD